MKLITLFLTCATQQEAKKISDRLLEEKLAACIKITDVKSEYLWKGKKQHGEEALLIIDSVEEKFDEIEKAVKKIHSYDTFVMTAYSVARSSTGVEKWVKEELG